ncbi:hypothetical protein NC661_05335 [Aquibacillus koreensis]|uniref:Uncharacterized protein n=1 Tax=Aquibacillus koreensis TaxID=279446 RepID=A0A9X3WLZ1_9BACI|nr:hypothetical protein [Aquibacillus koreensis]MCT2535278.1 hypothetical protein [Aquibacillus koreensis]MDC3419789.1 hypothetical protein [Aquibacillus koreensis]
MSTEQQEALSELRKLQEQVVNGWIDYWNEFVFLESWQFWVNMALFLLPLIFLFFFLDRKKAFLIGFFGFNIHIWLTYIHIIGGRFGYWDYPYLMFPFIPSAVELNASLIPVAYMLIYQWTQNHNRNYYLYATLLAAVIAFLFMPLLIQIHIFAIYNGVNYLHLFVVQVVVVLISKWNTNLYHYFKTKVIKIY